MRPGDCRMLTVTIPYPPTEKGKSAFCKRYGLNAYYAGKHWSARKRDAQELHQLLYACLRQQHIRQGILQAPVHITFYWNDGMDVDNHAVIGKAFVDALKGYLIQDDNRAHFVGVTHLFWSGDTIKMEIQIVGGEPL